MRIHHNKRVIGTEAELSHLSHRPCDDVVSGMEICAHCTNIHRGRAGVKGGGGGVQGRVGNLTFAEVAPKQNGPSTVALSRLHSRGSTCLSTATEVPKTIRGKESLPCAIEGKVDLNVFS